MLSNVFFEKHAGLPRPNPGLYRCTREAYRTLPEIDRPRMLDIACASGAPTLQLIELGEEKSPE